ncbi:ferredoxin [uncultured Eubacterium sp.]|uniref:ferredoxin n=1 Tax=uncultured Eubacterium sp. TaxID=165185 RepID=UPI0025FFB0F4|nr:ferredoxin [uncultured Eubacterium sp.]
MNQIKRVCSVYFSPCGSVKQIVSTMAQYAGEQLNLPVVEMDFTLPEQREGKYIFEADELVFFGTPVYAGRVPNKIMPYVGDGFTGNGAYAVPIVVFGNRNFDDALVELSLLLEQNGFQTVAGAAVVSRHVFSKVIASDRPSEQDKEEWKRFVGNVLWKLEQKSNYIFKISDLIPGTNPPEKYYTPLGIDGQPAKFLKAHPKTDSALCKKCGICAANCPMGTIHLENPSVTEGVCIKCQSCIQKCPMQAKYFDDLAFLSHKQMLEQNFARPAASVFIS